MDCNRQFTQEQTWVTCLCSSLSCFPPDLAAGHLSWLLLSVLQHTAKTARSSGESPELTAARNHSGSQPRGQVPKVAQRRTCRSLWSPGNLDQRCGIIRWPVSDSWCL